MIIAACVQSIHWCRTVGFFDGAVQSDYLVQGWCELAAGEGLSRAKHGRADLVGQPP